MSELRQPGGISMKQSTHSAVMSRTPAPIKVEVFVPTSFTLSNLSSVGFVWIGIEVLLWSSDSGCFGVTGVNEVQEEVGLSEHFSLKSTPCILDLHFGDGFN